MSLSFQRPHQSYFLQQRTGKQNHEYKTEEQAAPPQATVEPELHDFLRFYPLSPEVERPPYGQKQNRTKQVAPLPVSRNPLAAHARQLLQPRQNMPVQPPAARQAAPANNTQHHPPPAMPPTAPPSHLPHQAPAAHSQSNMPNLQAAAASPEMAAEQFRRINKSLPDGVMYEPLDEETMRLLKNNANIPKPAPVQQSPSSNIPHSPPPHPLPKGGSAPSPAPATVEPEKISGILQSLAQDEYNAKIFYSGVSTSAPSEEIKKALANLAKDCETRLQQYIHMLGSHFKHNFTPQEKEINTNLPFRSAMSLAVSEENKALATLGNLLDQVEETSLERQVQRIISKKILGHQLLLSYTIK